MLQHVAYVNGHSIGWTHTLVSLPFFFILFASQIKGLSKMMVPVPYCAARAGHIEPLT